MTSMATLKKRKEKHPLPNGLAEGRAEGRRGELASDGGRNGRVSEHARRVASDGGNKASKQGRLTLTGLPQENEH